VLAHLVKGLDNKAIGRALFISEDTVKSHVKGILRKLGARDRTQATAIALRQGLAQ
jgi:DNA-binding NarL/FixJ family response regulator